MILKVMIDVGPMAVSTESLKNQIEIAITSNKDIQGVVRK